MADPGSPSAEATLPEATEPAVTIPGAGRRPIVGSADPRTDSLPTLVAFSNSAPGPAGFFMDLGRSDPLSSGFNTGDSPPPSNGGQTGFDGPFPGTGGPTTDNGGTGEPPTGLPVDLPPFVEVPLPHDGPDADPVAIAALPEPASFVLILAGLVGLALVRRRSGRRAGGC